MIDIPRSRFIGSLVIAVLALAACGSETSTDASTSASPSTSAETTTATPSTSEASTEAPADVVTPAPDDPGTVTARFSDSDGYAVSFLVTVVGLGSSRLSDHPDLIAEYVSSCNGNLGDENTSAIAVLSITPTNESGGFELSPSALARINSYRAATQSAGAGNSFAVYPNPTVPADQCRGESKTATLAIDEPSVVGLLLPNMYSPAAPDGDPTYFSEQRVSIIAAPGSASGPEVTVECSSTGAVQIVEGPDGFCSFTVPATA